MIREKRNGKENEAGTDFTNAGEPKRVGVVIAHQHFGNGAVDPPETSTENGENKADESVLVMDNSPPDGRRMAHVKGEMTGLMCERMNSVRESSMGVREGMLIGHKANI